MSAELVRDWIRRVGVAVLWLCPVTVGACVPQPGLFPPSPVAPETGPGALAATVELPVTATPLPAPTLPEHPIYVIDPNDQGILSYIYLINADTAQVVWTITTRTRPDAALSPDGKRLYVADSYRTQVTRGELREVISVYDAASGELILGDDPLPQRLLYKGWPQPGHPNLFLSNDGRLVFAGLYGDPDIHQLRLAVLDAESLHVLEVNGWPDCAGKEPGEFAREACRRLTTLHVDRPFGKIDLPEGWNESGETLLALDKKRFYVGFDTRFPEADFFTDQVGVYDWATRERLAVLQLPGPVNQIALSADGKQLYAISPFTRSLAIYSTATYEALEVMEDLGKSPAFMLTP